MPEPIAVLIETASKRVFASALDWPGWARSGKTPDEALEALDSYRARYATVVKGVPRTAPLEVAERVKGDATTDFGAPSRAGRADARDLGASELRRQVKILRACW